MSYSALHAHYTALVCFALLTFVRVSARAQDVMPPEGDKPAPAPSEAPSAPEVAPPPTEPAPTPAEPEEATPPVPAEAPVAEPEAPEAVPSPSTEEEPVGSEVPEAVEVGAEVTAPTEPAQEPIEVTVVGTRIAKTPGSAHAIRQDQLERFETDDPHAILVQVPGVYVRQEDGVGLRPNIGIRGVNPDRSKKITLMEDGVLVGPAPYSAPAAYYFPLLTRMTGVRVIKGPSAVSYGPQTVGGAIDLLTRSVPSTTSAFLDVSGGQYGYAKVHGHVGASTERFGVLIEGVRLQNSGFMELPSGNNTGSERNEWMVKASYMLDPSAERTHEFGIKLTYSDERSNESYLGLTDADFRENPYRRYAAAALDRMINHRTSVVLSHTFRAPDLDLEVKTQAYRHDFKRVWRKVNRMASGPIATILSSPDDFANQAAYQVLTGQADSASPSEVIYVGPNDRTFVSQGVQSVARLDVQTGPLSHRLEAGLRFHHDSIDRTHSESGYLMQGGELVSDGRAPIINTRNRADSYAGALHVVDNVSWRDLSVMPGVRVELIGSKTYDYLTDKDEKAFVAAVMPGVGAYYGITRELGALAGVYRGFSPPPPGTDDDPEYSVNYEGGFRYTRGRARLETIAFFNDYSNLTNICTFSGGCSDENADSQASAGAARLYGVEVYAAHDFKFGKVTIPVQGAYTFSRGEFQNTFTSTDPIYSNVTKGDELPYLPRHQATGVVGVDVERRGASVSLNYVAPMREEPGKGAIPRALRTDEQFWLDLEAHAHVWGPISLYGVARNLLGAENLVSRRPYGARVNAPRWIQVGMKLNY